ncbi:hypothetical protein V6N13_099270 [Hibiscus sabdariffa]|uniref:Uncharacterized protein n=1 Tax=Hibiscus sabdariffa TaxID=183260 RepID=A0ABR2PZ66_9ROSI
MHAKNLSCEEGWAPREPVSSPHRIWDQSLVAAGKVDGCGFFEADSTKNVVVGEVKNRKNGTWSIVAGGGAGGFGGFLAEFGWWRDGGGRAVELRRSKGCKKTWRSITKGLLEELFLLQFRGRR